MRYSPEDAEKVTGVPADEIRAAAREYATERHAAIFYTLGITEHACGVDNIWSLSNLVLMTGHLGYESTGLNALRGQNNVQGLNDSGANPMYLPGYQAVDEPEIRRKFSEAWGTEVPETPGYRLDQMMSGLHDGRVRALVLIGENPAQTEPNARHVEEGLGKLDFLLSQDIFLHDMTRKYADVVFPASSFAEKDGTFTNTERRVSRVRRAAPLPGDAKTDLEIVLLLAKALGVRWPEYPDAESVWNELADLAPAWYGIRYDRLEENGMQWPAPEIGHPGTTFLHAPAPARVGGGKFYPVEYQRPIEEPDSEFPLVLSTGRTLYHYNSATMTMRESGIKDKQEDPFFEISAEDAVGTGTVGGRLGAPRLATRRPRGAGAHLGSRVPRARVDGTPLRRAEGQLAHARRRRPAHRHSRVQDQRRPGRAGSGPMSTLAADSLAPEAVDPHIRGRFGKPYLYEPECESTQLLLLGSGLPEGAVAVTDHQTAGRGRFGRRWETPPGKAVLVSVMLHPPAERHLPELSLAAALAVAEAIEGATGLTAQIKWPNDVMVNRRKVSGILSELSEGAVVVGIGINVNQAREELPLDAPTEPASLRTLTGNVARPGCAARLPAVPPRADLRRLAPRRARRPLRRDRRARLPPWTEDHGGRRLGDRAPDPPRRAARGRDRRGRGADDRVGRGRVRALAASDQERDEEVEKHDDRHDHACERLPSQHGPRLVVPLAIRLERLGVEGFRLDSFRLERPALDPPALELPCLERLRASRRRPGGRRGSATCRTPRTRARPAR